MNTRTRWGIAAGVGVVVLLVAFALFRPDKLFIDDVAEDELDADLAAALADATADTSTADTAAPDDRSTADEDAAPDTPEDTTTTAPAGPVVLARGEWTPLDHPGTGTVAIVEQDGRSTLVFDELMTDNGPDLYVYLSPAAVEPGADYIDGALRVDRLKGNVGTQTYELPDDVDTSQYASVVIWCDRFASGFVAAPLDRA